MVLLHSRHCSRPQNGGLERNTHYSTGPQRDFRLLADKPIVRSPRPQDFNRQLLALTRRGKAAAREQSVDKSVQRRWTSTTREATEEYALPAPTIPAPSSTLERCADSVRHRALKYQPEPCVWQQYAREWDVVQLRKPMEEEGYSKTTISLPKIPQRMSIVANHASPLAVKHDPLSFMRAMPGYGGFVPRHAIESKALTDEQCLTASMCSTSRSTYRRFPSGEYRELEFAHRGPLSKTVTLTYPFNAFNKVE